MKTVRKTACNGGSKTKSATEKETRTRIEIVRGMLSEMEAKIKEGKSTVGDYIRLLQLEKELEAEEPPREIRVTWIDRVETRDFEE